MIPKDFTPWESVYYYFSKWKNDDIIKELLDTLHFKVRIMSCRNENPSMSIIDLRSVKTSHHVDSNKGLDCNKNIKGRKQHIIIESQDNLISVVALKANILDSKETPKVI